MTEAKSSFHKRPEGTTIKRLLRINVSDAHLHAVLGTAGKERGVAVYMAKLYRCICLYVDWEFGRRSRLCARLHGLNPETEPWGTPHEL